MKSFFEEEYVCIVSIFPCDILKFSFPLNSINTQAFTKSESRVLVFADFDLLCHRWCTIFLAITIQPFIKKWFEVDLSFLKFSSTCMGK